MAGEDNVALVRRFVDEVWNRGNTQVIDELFAVNMVEHNNLGLEEFGEDQGAVIGLYGGVVTPIEVPGREGMRRRVLSLRDAFPDAQMTIDDIRAEGDLVDYRWSFSGTHGGQFR